MGKREAVRIAKKFGRALITSGIPINHLILYGSHAKGTARPDSDIDVAVVSNKFGKDKTEEGMLLFRIAGEIDSRIEPVPISLSAYEKDTWVPLIYEIRESGLSLKIANHGTNGHR